MKEMLHLRQCGYGADLHVPVDKVGVGIPELLLEFLCTVGRAIGQLSDGALSKIQPRLW